MANKRQKLEELASFSNRFYPKEIKTSLAYTKYTKDENKPYNILLNKITATSKEREKFPVKNGVAHWFIRDFRVNDNNGLSSAHQSALKNKVPMVCFWVNCPEEREAHGDSPLKHYYRMLSLEEVERKLKDLNIDLVTIEAPTRKDIVPHITRFLEKYKISQLYSNIEHEVDELRLAIRLLDTLTPKKIGYFPCHNTTIVHPGELKTKSKGTQYAVFSPWYRAWAKYINDHLLTQKKFTFPSLKEKLPETLTVDEKPNFPYGDVDKKKFHSNFKDVGEHDAYNAMIKYITGDKIKKYDETRDSLPMDTVSHLSIHLCSGTLSARTILQELYNEKKLSKSNQASASGITEWLRQISWRDFYRHIMCNWPYVCMHKPFHLELSDLHWEYNREHYIAWIEGRTGFPIVDACMRSLAEVGHLHNRGRLIVAAFLAKDLLLDWRYGEQYFMKNLVDGDFCSNNGGWGFAASTGVDPQPYFRIFNPYTQSERFDPDGEFIRKYIPELRDVKGPAIHNPYSTEESSEIARKGNYPEPIVDHKTCRERALERYKIAMQKGKEFKATH